MSSPRAQSPPPCYCITGHGRSGTSFIAAMMQSAGLDIGRRLLGAADSNRRGHFEDMDFLEFHIDVLSSQGFGTEGFIREPSMCVQEQFVEIARAMVQARREAGRPWGWKEPRSTLFLDFWREQVPELRFLLLFRRPWEVIDSLFRRGDRIYLKNPKFAVQVWENYNRAILDFHDRFPERCLVVETYAAAKEPQRLTRAIADRFGDHFGSIGDVYEEDLFSHETSDQHRSILSHLFPETVTLYEQLRSRAAVVHEEESAAASSAYFDWGLQHWIDFRRLESRYDADLRHVRVQFEESQRQVVAVRADLERLTAEVDRCQAVISSLHEEESRSRSELAQTRVGAEQLRTELELELERAEGKREELRGEVTQLRDELERVWVSVTHYRTVLAQVEAERDDARGRLGQAEGELGRLNQALQQTREHLAWVETSKFWKLRRFWHHVRSRLRPEPHPTEERRGFLSRFGANSRVRRRGESIRRDSAGPARL